MAVAGSAMHFLIGARAAVRRSSSASACRRADDLGAWTASRPRQPRPPRPRACSSATASSPVDGAARRPRGTSSPRSSGAKPGEEVTLAVERDGRRFDQGRHPRRAPTPTPAEPVGFLGIGPAYADEKVGALSGVQESFTEFGRITAGLGDRPGPDLQPPRHRATTPTCSTGRASSGPDRDERLLSPVGRRARSATERPRPASGGSLLLMAAINIFVGLFNLIPLLPFDGGHVAIATYEAIRSRRASATAPTSPSCCRSPTPSC